MLTDKEIVALARVLVLADYGANEALGLCTPECEDADAVALEVIRAALERLRMERLRGYDVS